MSHHCWGGQEVEAYLGLHQGRNGRHQRTTWQPWGEELHSCPYCLGNYQRELWGMVRGVLRPVAALAALPGASGMGQLTDGQTRNTRLLVHLAAGDGAASRLTDRKAAGSSRCWLAAEQQGGVVVPRTSLMPGEDLRSQPCSRCGYHRTATGATPPPPSCPGRGGSGRARRGGAGGAGRGPADAMEAGGGRRAVVVGAGLAGLGAAGRLRGLSSLRLLEAAASAGGRVCTRPFGRGGIWRVGTAGPGFGTGWEAAGRREVALR